MTGLGDHSGMEPHFQQMALSKAERSVRTGKATSVMPPHYLLQGDTTSWGSVFQRRDVLDLDRGGHQGAGQAYL
jgi:hypothetical protein